MPSSGDVTVLLTRIRDGDKEAFQQLVPIVHEELRNLAKRYMRRERVDHTLQATALVNEAYLKLVGQPAMNFQNRAHFLAIAANLMRQILVDHARRTQAAKRGHGERPISLDEIGAAMDQNPVTVLFLEEALTKLQGLSPQSARAARVFDLRFFGGVDVHEAAEVMGVADRTIERDWKAAVAWLRSHLFPGQPQKS